VKKVAVLGANGYIARNLIYVLKRDYPDFELALYGREKQFVDGEGNYCVIDMTDAESVKSIDLDVDIVFMFVGRTGSANGFDEYDSFIDINERTLLNLLSEYRRQRSKARIIYPSTRLVYKGKTGAQKEDAEKEFKTVYAINKFACEQFLEQFHRVYDVQYTILRVCIPYGTLIPEASSYGTAEFMLAKATKGENISLYGDGSVRRTLTYMDDLCVTMIKAAVSESCANDVFNVGGEDYSLKEMAEQIAQKYGVGVDYVPWPDVALKIESGDTVFDSSKLDSLIGSYTNSRFTDWVK
jgi:UDP-glucose 4-epimerase